MINTVEGIDLSIEELVREGFHRIHPVPARSWSASTRATPRRTSRRLREAGYDGAFRAVEEGVADYVRELLKA